MSLQVFESNEQIFSQKLQEFQKIYQRFGLTQQEKKKMCIEQMRLQLTEAENQGDKIKYMQMEYQQSQTNVKSLIFSKLSKHRSEFNDAKKRFTDMENSYIDFQNKKNVLGGVPQKTTSNEYEGVYKIANKNEQLIGQSNQLKDIGNVADQTEQAAINIQQSLYAQKIVMLSAIDDTDEIRRDLGLTNRQISLMKNRETFNKIILVAVIGILTIGNLMLIYYRMAY